MRDSAQAQKPRSRSPSPAAQGSAEEAQRRSGVMASGRTAGRLSLKEQRYDRQLRRGRAGGVRLRAMGDEGSLSRGSGRFGPQGGGSACPLGRPGFATSAAAFGPASLVQIPSPSPLSPLLPPLHPEPPGRGRLGLGCGSSGSRLPGSVWMEDGHSLSCLSWFLISGILVYVFVYPSVPEIRI